MVPTLQISGLASCLSAPARLLASKVAPLARRPKAVGTAPAALAMDPLAPLGGRLHAPILPAAPEVSACDTIVQSFADMARRGHWSDLTDQLTDADRSRTAAPGGRRLAALISEGARADLTAALTRRDWTAAESALQQLENALSPHAGTPAAAHLLAQAHLDIGWAQRSADPGPGVPRAVWLAFLQRTAQAEALLEPFDPIEEMSPLLAGTRYLLVRGLDEGDDLYQDWYEDWSDLDPTNVQPHLTHAVHLLPQWFGTLAGFDAAARAAMARTERVSGASAYACCYMAASDALGSLPERMDLPLFLAGLMDYFRTTGCQYRANIIAATMTELHHAYTIDAPGGSGRQRLVHSTLSQHLRENLREFHLSSWENGVSCIIYALEQVFGPELARGEHVMAGPVGLTTRLPN